MSIDFAGKTVLVTGAGHGFGRAIALAFLANGARVFACDVNAEGLSETTRLGAGKIETFPLDVGDPIGCERSRNHSLEREFARDPDPPGPTERAGAAPIT